MCAEITASISFNEGQLLYFIIHDLYDHQCCRTVLYFSYFYHYCWQGDIWSKIPFKVSENCGNTFMFSLSPSPCSAKVLAKTFLTCMLWGLVMQFMAGYLFLHCWNNLFGELLRFADREFYSVRLIVC